MFTIVIAERKIIKQFEKYRFFLSKLQENDEIAFCEWNKKAESITSMLPSLTKLVGKRTDWRAMVLYTDNQELINPFDTVQYSDKFQYKEKFSEGYLGKLREARFSAFSEAIGSPLTKLSYALCNPPVSDKNLLSSEKLNKIRDNSLSYGELMLEAQLSRTDIVKRVRNIEMYHMQQLFSIVGKENAEKILSMLLRKNAHCISAHLDLKSISLLIRLLCDNNTVFSDPMFFEQIIENTYKTQLLSSIKDSFELKCEKPKEVICIALRTADTDGYIQSRKWMNHDELEYSKFTEYNLYSDLLKFILLDVHDKRHGMFDYDMIRYLSFVLLLAGNEVPIGVVEKNRVYKAEIDDDTTQFMKLLSTYDDKLRTTASYLKEKQSDSSRAVRDGIMIDTEHLIQLVETPVSVPLVTDHPYTESMLTMNYSKLGFAKNCPADEHSLITAQYKDIRRNFIDFLKQPRQALSQASEDMRSSSTIDDESALYLNQYQCENVEDNIYEAEDKIVTAQTADIYNNAKYQAEMEKAKKEIDDCVKVRMTRKTTVVSGLIAIGAFFAGFIPLLASSTNTLYSWLFSLLVAVSACGALFAVGVWSLVKMRKKLRKLFVKFNNTMRKMMNEVKFAMNSFSNYLTNVCSFMRAHSVVNHRKEKERREVITAKIYQKHINDIENIRSDIRDAFGRIEVDFDRNADADIYEFDFTLPVDYTYDIPFAEQNDYYVEFLQEGNKLAVPICYINRILLRREELYD